MKFKGVAGLAAASLMILAQPAFASNARSGAAVPSAGVPANVSSVSRGSEQEEGASDFLSPLWIAFILALIGGLAATLGGSGGNNDSPG
jgi:hypothetical protein